MLSISLFDKNWFVFVKLQSFVSNVTFSGDQIWWTNALCAVNSGVVLCCSRDFHSVHCLKQMWKLKHLPIHTMNWYDEGYPQSWICWTATWMEAFIVGHWANREKLQNMWTLPNDYYVKKYCHAINDAILFLINIWRRQNRFLCW